MSDPRYDDSRAILWWTALGVVSAGVWALAIVGCVTAWRAIP